MAEFSWCLDKKAPICSRRKRIQFAMQKVHVKEINKNENETVSIIFAGDTCFGETYQAKRGDNNILLKHGYDYSFEKMKTFLSKSDMVVANLETPITDIVKSPFSKIKTYCHKGDIHKTPKGLLSHNISVVSLANNHSIDYGIAGFQQSLAVLKDNNIICLGAGQDRDSAAAPLFIQSNIGAVDSSIAVIAAFEDTFAQREKFSSYADNKKPGIYSLLADEIKISASKLKQNNPKTLVILYVHWGENYQWANRKQVKLAQAILNSNVDLIIGHGAHQVQQLQRHNGKWVAYGIGNFIFNSPGRFKKLSAPPYGLISKLIISSVNQQAEYKLRLYPILIDNKVTNYQTRFVSDTEFQDFCEQLVSNITHAKSPLDELHQGEDESGKYFEVDVKAHSPISNKIPRNTIGLICNIRKTVKPNKINAYWQHRAVTMNPYLAENNIRLIMYAPFDVNPETGIVTGYYYENEEFIPITTEVPLINYDWYLGSTPKRDNISITYSTFLRWAKEKHLMVYPPRSLFKLAGNKYLTYQYVSKFDRRLVPKTALFDGTSQQLQQFLLRSNCTFVKPSSGKGGNDLFVIRETKGLFSLAHYFNKEIQSFEFDTIESCLEKINKMKSDREYVIQKGINGINYHDSVFDIRVVVLNNGNGNQCIYDVRLGKKGSDLSNASQGGKHVPIETLVEVFGYEEYEKILAEIEITLMKLTNHIETQLATSLCEVAYDIVITESKDFHLLEINVKPGLLGNMKTMKNFYNMTYLENKIYEQYSLRHGTILAQFLLDKWSRLI